MSLSDYPYLRMRLAEEEMQRREKRQGSATTVKAKQDDDSSNSYDPYTLPVPTKENEFLGFCPSAIKLQNGDKKTSLKKRTEYFDSFSAAGVTSYVCSMKSCVFQGHISVDWVWKQVKHCDSLGIKCRWPFFAKSHVPQSAAAGKQYLFQCPLCVYLYGHAEGCTWKGVDMYLDHVSTHRGKQIPIQILQKLNIINDRTAEDKEDFDLNLFPLASTNIPSIPSPTRHYSLSNHVSGSETPNASGGASPPSLSRTATKTSFVDSIFSRRGTAVAVQPEEVNRAQGGRHDSVVAGPVPVDVPWSHGLSDFKMDKEEDYLSADF